jgi:hypothetical protein
MRSIGRNIKHLIDRPDEEYCFRLHKERVYYMSQSLCRRAAHAERSRPSHQLWLGRESAKELLAESTRKWALTICT